MFRSTNSLSETEAQVAFFFHVVIGGNVLGEFRAVSGLGKRVDAEELREGGRNHSPHLKVGPGKYQLCKIEWGMSLRATLFDWIHAVDAGYGYKRLVWIFQLDRSRTPLRAYQLWDAWPVSWEGARLNANDNLVDTEEIELAYELVTMIGNPGDITIPTFDMPDVTYTDRSAEVDEPSDLVFTDPVEFRTAKEPEDVDHSKAPKRRDLLPWLGRDPTGVPGKSVKPKPDEMDPDLAARTEGTVTVGDAVAATSEFEDVTFATGTFVEREEVARITLSSGVFIEPTEFELLTFEES